MEKKSTKSGQHLQSINAGERPGETTGKQASNIDAEVPVHTSTTTRRNCATSRGQLHYALESNIIA
eukprot:3451703-Amphidinium_carterae.1